METLRAILWGGFILCAAILLIELHKATGGLPPPRKQFTYCPLHHCYDWECKDKHDPPTE